jgi:hypothetical protein
MARLIPVFTDERTPSGERDVFNMFAKGPEDWVVLHALDLAPFNRGIRTEVDFVAIIPDSGIVCIEVKSHKDISFKNDRWNPSDIKRSPFKQAADGRYTFYRRLCQLAPVFKGIPVVHLCIFPNAHFDLAPNLSIQSWELLDGRAFRSFSSGEQFCAEVKSRMKMSITADQNLKPIEVRLSDSRVEAIISMSLAVQRHRPDRRAEIKHREHQAEQALREQQKPVLQLSSLNNRIVVTGPAGTGKTLIALEVARRKSVQGLRTGLFSFNRIVGQWMRAQIERSQPVLPNLVVGPAIKVMAEMANIDVPENPTTDFWESKLPDLIEEKLTDPDFRAEACFDYMVIDEAQDILSRPRIFNCLSHFLVGGFESGNYAFFGDIKNQVIADRRQMLSALAALEKSSAPARWELSENCRNYQIIGDTAAALSGFSRSIYSGYLRAGGSSHHYDLDFYEDDINQVEMLKKILHEFRNMGYRANEITVLSFCGANKSAAERLCLQGVHLSPIWKSSSDTNYGTIHAFKGMESKIVVLTDLDLEDAEIHRTLFYIGMTRATEFVRILCHTRSKATLLQWLAKEAVHE